MLRWPSLRLLDGLDQLGPLVSHGAHGARDRVPGQAADGQAGRGVRRATVLPVLRAAGVDDHRHSVMDGIEVRARRLGQDGAGQPLMVRQREVGPQPGKQQRRRVARRVDVEGLFRAVERTRPGANVLRHLIHCNALYIMRFGGADGTDMSAEAAPGLERRCRSGRGVDVSLGGYMQF